ncbi:MAG: hypothetical protein AAGA85_16545 [Bacteroidota bacterium]
MTTKVDFAPYAAITWDDEVQALRVQWIKQHLSLDQFKEIIEKAWSILKQHEGYVWISDMYESQGVFPPEIKDYIVSDEVAARSNEMGVRWALTIMPKSVGLASMSTKSWNNGVKSRDSFVVEEFPDWSTCKGWLKTQISAMSA